MSLGAEILWSVLDKSCGGISINSSCHCNGRQSEVSHENAATFRRSRRQ